MTIKRTISGTKYNIAELVDNAIAAVDTQALDLETASKSLARLGHRNPDAEIIARYARESAILKILADETGANFSNQIGKINFSSREKTISGVESYLNRRIHGQHARWTEMKKGQQ